MLGKTPFLNGTAVGHYKLSTNTGLTTGLGAGAPIFIARFNSTAGIRGLLLYLKIQAQTITPFTGAAEVAVIAKMARGYTTGPSGGTLLTPFTAGQQSMNSLGDQTSILEARVATTTALTTGTSTQDPSAFLSAISAQLLAAASAAQVQAVGEWAAVGDYRYPISFNSLAPNQEGFLVQATPAQGAGGTVRYYIDMEWVEYQGGANVGTLV